MAETLVVYGFPVGKSGADCPEVQGGAVGIQIKSGIVQPGEELVVKISPLSRQSLQLGEDRLLQLRLYRPIST